MLIMCCVWCVLVFSRNRDGKLKHLGVRNIIPFRGGRYWYMNIIQNMYFSKMAYVLVLLGDTWVMEGWGAMDMRRELRGLTWGVC